MDDVERHARQELMILDPLLRAMDRRDEVLQIIEDSEDADEARRRVAQLLGVDGQSCRMAAEDSVS